MSVEYDTIDGHASLRVATRTVIAEVGRDRPSALDIPARGRSIYSW